MADKQANLMIDQKLREISLKIKELPDTDGLSDAEIGHVAEMLRKYIYEYDELLQLRIKSTQKAISTVLVQEKVAEIRKVADDARRSETTKTYIAVTVNPPPNIPPEYLIAAVRGFFASAVVDHGCYCFEQRGVKEGDYQGFHSHFYFKRARKPTEVWKRFTSLFGSIVNVKCAKFFNVKSSDDQRKFRGYYSSYMLGHKKDEKLDKVANDACMRTAYGLEPIYYVRAPDYLLGASAGGSSVDPGDSGDEGMAGDSGDGGDSGDDR